MTKETIINYIISYSKEKSYFQIDKIKNYLLENKIYFKQDTLKKYIYILKKDRKLYSAGRGWYSTIEKEFKLDKKPIENIVRIIQSDFPQLEFSCWSTEQIKGYFQHLPNQFIAFIYSDREYLSTIKDFLNEKDFNVYLNPYKNDVDKFVELKNRNIILRPSVSYRISKESIYAKIEKILVDLFMEMRKINFLGRGEYKNITSNIILNYRINMAEMVDYAYNRKIVDDINKIILEISKIH